MFLHNILNRPGHEIVRKVYNVQKQITNSVTPSKMSYSDIYIDTTKQLGIVKHVKKLLRIWEVLKSGWRLHCQNEEDNCSLIKDGPWCTSQAWLCRLVVSAKLLLLHYYYCNNIVRYHLRGNIYIYFHFPHNFKTPDRLDWFKIWHKLCKLMKLLFKRSNNLIYQQKS